MRNARAVAKQKATLDLIEKVESTEHYRKLNQTFSRLRRGDGFAHLHNPQSDADKSDRRDLNDYMNHYEMVSVGILHEILDENFYKMWMQGPFVRDWNAASDWVQRERWKKRDDGTWDYYSKVFCNYESVACRWSKDGIKLNRLYSSPPTDQQAGGPGDEPFPESAETAQARQSDSS